MARNTGLTTDSFNTKRTHIRDTKTLLEEFQREDHKIMANLGLSQQGQREKLKKYAIDETIKNLKWQKKEIEDLEAKVKRLRSEFLAVDSTIKDPAERISTFIYLWQKLDVLDPNGRTKRFALAGEKDEVKTLAAMLSHPEGEMVPQDVKERVLFERAARLRPQDHTNLEQAELLLEFLVMIRDWISKWLSEEIGVEPKILRDNLGADIADVPQLAGAST
jgi:uncharacterized protein YhaN